MLHVSRWKTVLIWFCRSLERSPCRAQSTSDQQLASFQPGLLNGKSRFGLDLQGGSHIMLKIERGDVVRDRLETLVGDISARLRTVNIGYTGLTGIGPEDPASVSTIPRRYRLL